jgi:predicted RNA-binding Zn-ribbon protein involved in translation (DUF1610 family)
MSDAVTLLESVFDPVPALIVHRNADVFWCCPNCDKTMGKIYGDTVVIRMRASWSYFLPLVSGARMPCPKCGTATVWDDAQSYADEGEGPDAA